MNFLLFQVKFSLVYLVLINVSSRITFAFPEKTNSSNPKHILQLSKEEKREFLNSFDYVLSDIDGVVWNFYGYIEGTPDGYKALQKAGKNITFITNNSNDPMKKILKKFKKVNMEVDEASVLTPVQSTISYLKSIDFKGLIYIISSETLKNSVEDAGFEYIDGPNEPIEESFSYLNDQIIDDQPVRAVILDLDLNFSLVKLLRAQFYLKKPDCLLIIGATNQNILLQKDFNPLTMGVFAEILPKAMNKEAIVVGKPGDALVDVLKRDLNFTDPKRVLMIGDTLKQDIGFAQKAGFQTLFVLTGDNKLDEINEHVPDYYADSMADFRKFERDME